MPLEIMKLENLIKIPYDSVYKQFYQYENDGEVHQIEYEFFAVEGEEFIICTKVPKSDVNLGIKCEKGYQNWF